MKMQPRTTRFTILFLVLLVIIFSATSCATGRDPWGNKQTKKERKELNEMGCPGHKGFLGYGNP